MLFGEDGESEVSPVVEELKGMDVASMTPIEAINRLAELKKKAGGA